MKKIIKNIIGSLVFASLFFIILFALQKVLVVKTIDSLEENTLVSLDTDYPLSYSCDGFYALRRNTLDIAVIGSSRVYAGVDTNIIWDELGATCYDFTASSMRIATSYYALEETFRTQSPSVVVMEGALFDTGQWLEQDFTYLKYMYYYSPLSPAKLPLAVSAGSLKKGAEVLFPIISEHGRWDRLEASDWRYLFQKGDYALHGYVGYDKVDTTLSPDAFFANVTDSRAELTELTRQYILKMKALCESNGAVLYIIMVPSNEADYFSNNAIGDFCFENGIEFCDYNRSYEEIGLEPTDFPDISHLNISGAEKFTRLLASDIAEILPLENRKGDPKYDFWEDSFTKYSEIRKELQD